MSLHKKHPISLGGTLVGGIQECNLDPGVGVTRPRADGTVDGYFVAANVVSPRLAFSSLDVAALLGITNWTAATGAVVAYDAKIVNAGTKASTGNHNVHTMASALIVPRRLSVGVTGDAVMSAEAFGYNASGAEPLLSATSGNLGSYTQDTNKVWAMGPLTVNGSSVTGVQSLDFDFGMQVMLQMADGYPWPKDAVIGERMPVLQFSTTDANLIALFCGGSSGSYYSGKPIASTTKLFLRKRSDGGVFVADGTAEHVSVTFPNGMIYWQTISDEPRRIAVAVVPHAVSGSAAVVIDPATAIS